MLRVFRLLFLLIFIAYSPAGFTESKEFTYEKITIHNHQIIHVVGIPADDFTAHIAQPDNTLFNRDTVASLAKQHKATVAINGGFFRTGEGIEGLPAGILKFNREWVNLAYQPRGAIGWSQQDNTPLFDRIQTQSSVIIEHQHYPLHHVNTPNFKRSGLFNHHFRWFPRETLNRNGYLIQFNSVQEIFTVFPSYIPKEAMLYLPEEHNKSSLTIGQMVTPSFLVLPRLRPNTYEQWQDRDNILGGAPLLIHNNTLLSDFSSEKLPRAFLYQKHARSAIGWKEGKWVVVMVEQNPLLSDTGMTIPELAQYMKTIGCSYALNLDGGGSSALYVEQDGEVLGPRSIREVANALVFVPKPRN